jgi:hypothetical protein
VRGNVICGGAEKTIYRTDWSALGTGSRPRRLRDRERVVDELDVADLVSEREHQYEFPHPAMGFVDTKVLPDPTDVRKDMFDAGRRIPDGRSERFRLRRAPDLPAHLLIRTAIEREGMVRVRVDGKQATVVRLAPADGWQELLAELPSTGRNALDVELTVERTPDWVDYHVWLVQAP